MSSWYTSNLGDALLADAALEHIKSLFAAVHKQAQFANNMAIFVRHESAGRIHCEVKVYFSPATVAVAQALNATPCNMPSVDGLSLLAGQEEARQILFHNRIV